jgi:dihydrofolate reductase
VEDEGGALARREHLYGAHEREPNALVQPQRLLWARRRRQERVRVGLEPQDVLAWLFQQRVFRQRLKLGEGGDTRPDNRFLEEIFDRTGVSIMGKRMFELGERSWPEEPSFHTPVFVVTHEVRAPWARKGGTTFHFVNEGIEDALRCAREVCGGKDIRISVGANLVGQYMNAGVVDELALSVAPTFLAGKVKKKR